MADDWTSNLYDKVIDWALEVDEAGCRREVDKWRSKHAGLSDRDLAKKIVDRYALVAFGEGAVTGLVANPALALPAALFDAAFVMRASARLNGAAGLLANGRYLESDDWKADVMTIVGDKPIAQQAARRTTMRTMHRVGGKLTNRFGTRTVSRAVPIVSSLVGGVWNYLEVRNLGRQFVKYHFAGPGVRDVESTPTLA